MLATSIDAETCSSTNYVEGCQGQIFPRGTDWAGAFVHKSELVNSRDKKHIPLLGAISGGTEYTAKSGTIYNIRGVIKQIALCGYSGSDQNFISLSIASFFAGVLL